MTNYLIAKNWNYIGNCGCKINMGKYTNTLYPFYEIRVGIKQPIFEIRKHQRTIHSGTGQQRLEEVYQAEFETRAAA